MIGKRIIIAALVIPWFLSLTPIMGHAEDGFLPGVEDLPLMPELRELPEARLIFDKPDGRLVQAMASGDISPAALWRFYDETLPQLGWHRRARGHFVRDGEELHISAKKSGETLMVRFAIAPGSE